MWVGGDVGGCWSRLALRDKENEETLASVYLNEGET